MTVSELYGVSRHSLTPSEPNSGLELVVGAQSSRRGNAAKQQGKRRLGGVHASKRTHMALLFGVQEGGKVEGWDGGRRRRRMEFLGEEFRRHTEISASPREKSSTGHVGGACRSIVDEQSAVQRPTPKAESGEAPCDWAVSGGESPSLTSNPG